MNHEKIALLEKRLCQTADAGFGVVFSEAAAAWEAAFLAAGVMKGKEVVLSPLASPVAAKALAALGAEPVFADVWEDTLNIKPKALEMSCSPETAAIVVNDFAGHPADLAPIGRIAKSYRVSLLHDVSHSLGCDYQGGTVGSLADISLVSFEEMTGSLTAGAAVLANIRDVRQVILDCRDKGLAVCVPRQAEAESEVLSPRKGSFSVLEAEMVNDSLAGLAAARTRRTELAAVYEEILTGIAELKLPRVLKRLEPDWSSYAVRLSTPRLARQEVVNHLNANAVDLQLPGPPLYMLEEFQDQGYFPEMFPVTDNYFRNGILLPLKKTMSREETVLIANSLRSILRQPI